MFGDTNIAILSRTRRRYSERYRRGNNKRDIEMEIYEGKIAVSKFDLTRDDDGDAIMTIDAYKYGVKKRRFNVLRRGCLCTPALIEYDTLPERFRLRFEEKYGDPHVLLKAGAQAIVINDEARTYFTHAIMPDGNRLSAEKVNEYTMNASVLDSLRMEYEGQKLGRRSAGTSTAISWGGIKAVSEALREYTKHTLPESEGRLRDKLLEYMRDGYECLIHRAHGHATARKITEEGGRLIVALRRSNHPIYDIDDILEKYNEAAAEKGWKQLRCRDSIKKYLERPEIEPLWYSAVYGELAAKQKFDRKQRTEMPARRDSLWYGDGTKLNIYYMGRNGSGKPALRTLYVYEVIDAYSEMMLGYAIGTHETSALQRRAFRMAVETAGHKPFEIVTDNQGGQKTDEALRFMSHICHISRRTAPYTPQAKSIESIFGRFQSKVLKKDIFFTGMNVTAKKIYSRPRMEYIEANRDKCYTFEEVCEAYGRYREVWNDRPYPATRTSRRERYYASANFETAALTAYDMVDMFWSETEAEFTSMGIEIQVGGVKRAYEVFDADGNPDYEFRERNTGRRFVVKYDPDDMSWIWLNERSSVGVRPVCKAYPYAAVHRAMQEQMPEEQRFIRESVEANKRGRIRRRLEGYAIEAEHGVAPEQHGFRTPRIAGISKRDEERIYDDMVIYPSAAAHGEADDECTPLTEGEVQKQISGMVYSDIDYRTLNKF